MYLPFAQIRQACAEQAGHDDYEASESTIHAITKPNAKAAKQESRKKRKHKYPADFPSHTKQPKEYITLLSPESTPRKIQCNKSRENTKYSAFQIF